MTHGQMQVLQLCGAMMIGWSVGGLPLPGALTAVLAICCCLAWGIGIDHWWHSQYEE